MISIINLIIIYYFIKDMDDNGYHLIDYILMYFMEKVVEHQQLVLKQDMKELFVVLCNTYKDMQRLSVCSIVFISWIECGLLTINCEIAKNLKSHILAKLGIQNGQIGDFSEVSYRNIPNLGQFGKSLYHAWH